VPESLIRSFSGTLNARRRRQLRDSLHINDSEKLLVYAGSLWKKKIPNVGIRDLQGVELLCEAFEKANEQGTPTTLLMLGFSKQASELDKFRKGKWRERLIEWGSYKAGSEKHLEALGGADYLCLPSFPCETYALYDRFKTIEYMAAGKRIIAADTDINRTILKEMGRYYDDGDSSSMGQLIADLPLNENLIFDQNLNENALQNYNWDRRISEKAIDKVIWGDA
jgi:glycosyltransferase involved in cell wall biosynthesis